MTELLILRHGTAEDFHPEGDRARALVEEGHRQATRAGQLLKEMGGLPDIVLTSPLVRTVETARDFCRAATLDDPLIQPWLASGMHPQQALAELQAFAEFERVAIVGHEPDLSSLIETLLGVTNGSVEMKKGALACIGLQSPGGRGRLRYLIPPRVTSAGSASV